MKKLSKLRIIEEGRSCSPEEMNKMRGGVTCTTGSTYKDCDWRVYTICSEVSHTNGYTSDDGDTVCNVGYSYSACITLMNKVSCSGDQYYNSFPLG